MLNKYLESHVKDIVCERCGLTIDGREVGKAKIDGEHAHIQCALDEQDETGLDDFFGD